MGSAKLCAILKRVLRRIFEGRDGDFFDFLVNEKRNTSMVETSSFQRFAVHNVDTERL